MTRTPSGCGRCANPALYLLTRTCRRHAPSIVGACGEHLHDYRLAESLACGCPVGHAVIDLHERTGGAP